MKNNSLAGLSAASHGNVSNKLYVLLTPMYISGRLIEMTVTSRDRTNFIQTMYRGIKI